MTATDQQAALTAARLMGHTRPHRTVPTADLLAQGEYALRSLTEAKQEGEPQMAAYYEGLCDGIKEETDRRLALAKQTFQAPARISADAVQRIKQAVPCYEYVAHSGVVLKRSGQDHYLGLCPFHVEKSPSFHVWRDHFYCFGCQVGGDVFEWARHGVGIHAARRGGSGEASFVDAVRELANYAGLPDPMPKPKVYEADL